MTLTCEVETSELSSDTRRQPRMELFRPVRFFEPFSGEYHNALTCNVSAEGVCIQVLSRLDLRPGRFITVHGNLMVGPRLSGTGGRAMTARVIWTSPDPEDDTMMRVGLHLYAKSVAVAA